MDLEVFKRNNRVLVVDDNEAIHEDFIKILDAGRHKQPLDHLDEMEMALFDDTPAAQRIKQNPIHYRIDSAFQGKEAYDMVKAAHDSEDPYALILMDVRMPPGMDGIATLEKIWSSYPYTEVVIVTAYSDYTWEEIVARFGVTDHLLFLKKPFDPIVVKQMALTLTTKWTLSHLARKHIQELSTIVGSKLDALPLQ